MAKNAAPKMRPRAIFVRRIVQKTWLKPTSRNHNRSTKNPESAVKPARSSTSATPAMISHRRPRPAWMTRATPVLSVPGTRQPIIEALAGRMSSGSAPQVVQRILERRHRHEVDAVAPHRSRGGDVALGNEEHRRSGMLGGDDLLLDAPDGIDRAVQSDLPRAGDGPAARQIARGEEVVQPERPHQPRRRTPDIPTLDPHPEREVRDERHPDQGLVSPATGRSAEVHAVLLAAGPDVERERRPRRCGFDHLARSGRPSDRSAAA